MFRTALISICLICSATSADTPVVYEDYKLLASDGENSDRFGNSISISSDGTTAIVGAYYNDSIALRSGSAYIYELVGGVWQETKLTASDGAEWDYLGYSVSISSDGSTAIVGAHRNNSNGSSSGSAYIYELVGGVWQETKLIASDGAIDDKFGISVSISGDGSTAIVGAHGDDDNGSHSGSAYIYSLVEGVWQETKLTASDGADEDRFGVSVSISSDGTTAIVGAHFDDDNGTNSGSAYIYELVGGVWQETKLVASDGASDDKFGRSVSISGDGSTTIVGAYDHDINDGKNSGYDSGAAYIYELVKGVWQETKLTASDWEEENYFGRSVSISSDGSTALVGQEYFPDSDDNGPNPGSAYIFKWDGSNWIEQTILLPTWKPIIFIHFSSSVSISSDGTTAIVGARGGDNGNETVVGSAYIYYLDDPVDTDGDGVPDNIDNCYLSNPDQEDCNGNGVGDVCDLADGVSVDCNENSIPDICDIADGTSIDLDQNGIPDECDPDCDGNGIPDYLDIIWCNFAPWCGDCNQNGIPDACDISDGPSNDINQNGTPDECECMADLDGDGEVRVTDLLMAISVWGPCSACPEDMNGDDVVDVTDLLILIAAWGPCP